MENQNMNPNINRNQYPVINQRVIADSEVVKSQQKQQLQNIKQSSAANPLLKGFVEKFFDGLKGLSPAHKIDLIYKNLTGAYPDQKKKWIDNRGAPRGSQVRSPHRGVRMEWVDR